MTTPRTIPVVTLLCGGQSPEHSISLRSARSALEGLVAQTRVDTVQLVVIDEQGLFQYIPDTAAFLSAEDDLSICAPVRVQPTWGGKTPASWQWVDAPEQTMPVGVVMSMLHGSLGEDGAMQGLLELMHVPYVGANVLGSAVAMHKVMTKRVLRDAGIAVVPFMTADVRCGQPSYDAVVAELGSPFFIKPACAGSSVGISYVCGPDDYESAWQLASDYDTCILFERAIKGREIECAVLGYQTRLASLPGEIFCGDDFYSYAEKYSAQSSTRTQVPAQLSPLLTEQIQALAVRACEVLGIDGMARVDFFLNDEDQTWYVNEINTLPGFTDISLYPQMWAHTGVDYVDLLWRLLCYAITRASDLNKLLTASHQQRAS